MTARPWPWSLAAREGLATARTGRFTSVLLIIAAAWGIAAPGAADALGVHALVVGEQRWIAAGGHVFKVTGARTDAGTNPVSAVTCDRLTQIEGVTASFAVQSGSARAGFEHIPGGRAPLIEVTPGAAGFLGLSATPGASVVVSTALAERTGVRDGELVRLVRTEGLAVSAASTPITARVASSAVMGEEYDGALFAPTALLDSAEACFVRTDAAHHSAVETVLPGLLAHDGQAAVAQPRLYSSEFTLDYTEAYEQRPLRWLWIAAAALLVLVWLLTRWSRRSQLAIYATFGMPAASRLVMQLTEWAVLVAVALPWGWGLGVVWSLALGAAPLTAIAQVSLHAVLTVLAATVGVVIAGLGPTGSLLNALKDRS